MSHRAFQENRNRSLGSVMAALEAEADAIFEAFANVRHGERASRRDTSRNEPEPEARQQEQVSSILFHSVVDC